MVDAFRGRRRNRQDMNREDYIKIIQTMADEDGISLEAVSYTHLRIVMKA